MMNQARPKVSCWRQASWVASFMALVALWAPGPSTGQSLASDEQPNQVSYHTQIRPLLQARCFGCHQPAKPGGQYIMTAFDSLLQGGESGTAAIVPGSVKESHLVDLITPVNGVAEMPKGGPPLTDRERALVARWIAAGAPNDTPAASQPTYDRQHPPQSSQPPVIRSLDFSPDGRLLAIAGYHEVLLHKADGSGLVGRLIGLAPRIESVRFSPDGKLLAAAGGNPARIGELQVWELEQQQLKFSVHVTSDSLFGVSWSPDGKLISFGGTDHALRALESETGKQILFSAAHNDLVLGTAFSVDGTHLVSVSRDRTMKLVEVSTQRFVDNITSITPGALKGGIAAVDRHPTLDELLVGGADGQPKTYRMYRTKTREIGDDYQKIHQYPALPGRVCAVRYSPDGKHIAVGSSDLGTGLVRVCQTDGKAVLWEYSTRPVYVVAFSPDGRRVAAAGFDGHVRLFDASQGKLIKEFVPVPLTTEELHDR